MASRIKSNGSAKNALARLGAWLELMRVANLPSVISNVLAAYILVALMWHPIALVLAAALAACLLYAAGVVLNDVYDEPVDRRHRPQRAIPSGRVGLTEAKQLGYGLLFAGWGLAVGLALAVGPLLDFLAPGEPGEELQAAAPLIGTASWLAMIVVTLLAANIVAYDRWLKHTYAGPASMGACRGLNVLWVAAVAWAFRERLEVSDGVAALWSHSVAAYAVGLGVVVAGITWLARQEAGQSARGSLAGATVVMIAGVICLASIAWWPTGVHRVVEDARATALATNFHLLILLLAAPAVFRALAAIADPRPAVVQRAVIVALGSLLFFDAAIVWWATRQNLIFLIPFALLFLVSLLLRTISRPT